MKIYKVTSLIREEWDKEAERIIDSHDKTFTKKDLKKENECSILAS